MGGKVRKENKEDGNPEPMVNGWWSVAATGV